MRSPSCEMSKADLKKGSWSHEEDEMLKAYIKRYGIWNWSHMPKFAGLSRTGKSCRLRWMNYLKPNVKKGNFTKEEEEIIIHSHSLLGNRWSAIASRIPGRTDNDIKNYWHAHLKKRVNHNLANGTTKQMDWKSCEAHEVNKLQNVVNHVTDYCASPSSLTFEEDSSSFNCSNFSIDQVVEFKDDYYNIGSPGTIDDLNCFWDQLCPLENLELIGSNHKDLLSASIFQDSYQDSLNLYG